MSSTVAYRGLPRAEAYGASKAAIKHLFESLQIDLQRDGIAVSVVCPGFVRTPLTDRNDFPMPFLVEVDEAARRIVDGIEARRPEIHFPKRFSIPYKLLALLPHRLYSALCSRMVRPT
jgi:short-subunit dehydrogenase